VGLSGQLFPANLIQSEDWEGIKQRVEVLQTNLYLVQNHP